MRKNKKYNDYARSGTKRYIKQNGKPINVTLNKDTIRCFEDNIGNMSYTTFLHRAVSTFVSSKYLVFELYCKRANAYYIGTLDNYIIEGSNMVNIKEVTLSTMINNSNDDVLLDVKHFGYGEFKSDVLCYFGSMSDANNYISYLLNSHLDKGNKIYNHEIAKSVFTRYFSIPVDYVVSHKILNYCFKRKMYLSDLFNLIISKFQ